MEPNSQRLLGILDSNMVDSLLMQGYKGQKLDIIVENTGRVNYGKEMRNGKKVGGMSVPACKRLLYGNKHYDF